MYLRVTLLNATMKPARLVVSRAVGVVKFVRVAAEWLLHFMARVYYYNIMIYYRRVYIVRRVVHRTIREERHQTTRPYPLRIITSHRLES